MKRAITWLVIFLLLGGAAWLGLRKNPSSPVATRPAEPVDLTKHDGETIDFSSGRPVVKDSSADRAAIEQAKREMDEAVKGVTFGPPTKPPEAVPGSDTIAPGAGGNATAAGGNPAPATPPKKG